MSFLTTRVEPSLQVELALVVRLVELAPEAQTVVALLGIRAVGARVGSILALWIGPEAQIAGGDPA